MQFMDKSYGSMFSDYLIDCCLINELACFRKSPQELNLLVRNLSDHWDEFEHYHKHLIKKEMLLQCPTEHKIVFPKIIRSMACSIAKRYVGNPMTNRTEAWIAKYVCELSDEEPWTNK